MRHELRKIYGALKELHAYYQDFLILNSQSKSAAREFPFGALRPCLNERRGEGGTAKGHYFHQDLLVARRIFRNQPRKHLDIGSRVDGFVAHVASFRDIEVLDIRPVTAMIPNIRFLQADLMAPMDDNLVDYCDSLSCLHALEHFGLGRYGDPIMYDGYLLGLQNIWTILKKHGAAYISVPIGPQRIEFNAHRVFCIEYLLECFAPKYEINTFSFVDDHGDLHEDVPLTATEVKGNFGCEYGCGIFEMTKT